MLTQFSAIDKVSIYALAKKIEAEYEARSINDLASKLDVPLMSESRNRNSIIDRITRPKLTPQPVVNDQMRLLLLAKRLILFLMLRALAYQDNKQRRSYAPWFKAFLLECKTDHSYQDIATLTDISIETLSGLTSASMLPSRQPMSAKAEALAAAWLNAPADYRRTLDSFWYYLGKKHPDLAVSNYEVREILVDLGLRHPRGPATKNHGTQVKRSFSPHALWEGDGKVLKININGCEYQYLWYAFVDQQTTLLVGSSITDTESAESFLSSLKDGKQSAGTYPIGVVIDNRFEASDLSPITSFAKEYGIVIVKTFKGNSKSNGHIENNFSIFERFVGQLVINGQNETEISQSIAKAIIEVFTQLRNHTPRLRLKNRSPAEAVDGAERPEDTRTEIEKMARRFDKEQPDIEAKWQLIERARACFGSLSPASELKIKSNYSPLLRKIAQFSQT